MKKIICFTVVLAFTTVAFAQNPSPSESPSASPAAAKHKHAAKKKEASPGPSQTPSASPAAEKDKHSKKKDRSSSTAASPSPAKRSWFQKLTNPTPTASPAATASERTKGSKQAEAMGTPEPGGGPRMVWVNTDTHVYHKEGSRWYGRTKKGKYMKESEAIKEGDREEKESAAKSKKT